MAMKMASLRAALIAGVATADVVHLDELNAEPALAPTQEPTPEPTHAWAPAPTPVPAPAHPPSTEYHLVTLGSCAENGFITIDSESTCAAAAKALGLSDTTPKVSTETPRPEGCYWWKGGKLILNTNTVNVGFNSKCSGDCQPICAEAVTPRPTLEPMSAPTPAQATWATMDEDISQNIGDMIGVLSLIMFACTVACCGWCRFRRRKSSKCDFQPEEQKGLEGDFVADFIVDFIVDVDVPLEDLPGEEDSSVDLAVDPIVDLDEPLEGLMGGEGGEGQEAPHAGEGEEGQETPHADDGEYFRDQLASDESGV